MSDLATLTAALIAKEGKDYITEFTSWANKVRDDLTSFQSALMSAVQATSTTSLNLAVGQQTATVQAGKSFVAGMRITMAYSATVIIAADVVSYSGTSLVFNVDSLDDIKGSGGPYASWTISMSGDEGAEGPAEFTWAGIKTAAYDLIDREAIVANTTGGTFPVGVPVAAFGGGALAAYNSRFRIIKQGLNALTIEREGLNLNGAAADVTVAGSFIGIIDGRYVDAGTGYRLTYLPTAAPTAPATGDATLDFALYSTWSN